MLHVLNGASVETSFLTSGIPGLVAVLPDILHEGPVPAGLDDEELARVRLEYWTSRGFDPDAEDARWFREHEARFARASEHDEVVLWFEHDLVDQLLLIHHLDWFARRSIRGTTLSLICIDRFPGVEPFHGLGQLTGEQLATLLPARTRVTREQLDLATRAWRAFRSADPRDIERLIAGDTRALPFLAGALRRHLEEFPAAGTGLPRTERQILTMLREWPRSPVDLFVAAKHLEERVYLGDAMFRDRLDQLADGERPLVVLDIDRRDERVLPPGTVSITAAGGDVLGGRVDWAALRPFDRWLGGVHVHAGNMWRRGDSGLTQ